MDSIGLFFLAIVGKYHYLLYFIALAIQPRMLVTFDESLRPLPVPVRVGQVNGPSPFERNLLKLFISRQSMSSAKPVNRKQSLVFKHTQHLFYWHMVNVLN